MKKLIKLMHAVLTCLLLSSTGLDAHAGREVAVLKQAPAGHPEPVSAAARQGKYSMVQAVERALAQNFTVVAAEADIQAAENQRKAVRGSFGPRLGANYSFDRTQHTDDDLYRWTVWLRQDVFSGFSTLAEYQKAALQKENAEAQMARTRLALILQVQQNFFLYLKAEADVRSAEDSLNRLTEQLKVTSAFYQVGLRPHLDVLQAEVNVSEAEDVLLRARNTVETQRVRLNTLLNIPLTEDASYEGDLEFIPFSRSLEECLEEAYRKRPDIIMAVKSVEIAQQDKTSAQSGYYPNITAEGSWMTDGDDWRASGGSSRSGGKSSAWSVGVTGSITAFSWGTTYYDVQRAQQIINRVRAEESDLRLEVAFEVQSRMLDLDNAAKRIRVARTGLEQAKEAYRVAAARYKSQVGTSLDVLDAQARLTAAEVSLSGAQADYLSALAALYAATGVENTNLAPM